MESVNPHKKAIPNILEDQKWWDQGYFASSADTSMFQVDDLGYGSPEVLNGSHLNQGTIVKSTTLINLPKETAAS